jgi:integrase
MPRKNEGTVRILQGPNGPQWHGKWTLVGKDANGKPRRSEWEPLDPSIALDDEAGAKAYAAKIAPSIRARSAQLQGKSEKVRDYADRWIQSRKVSVRTWRDDWSHLEHHLLPAIGDLAMAEVTATHGDEIVARLDAKTSSGELRDKSAINIWGTAKKVFKDAAHAKAATGLRCLVTSPFEQVQRPDQNQPNRVKQFLFPSEVYSLLDCTRVRRSFRRNVAIAVYLGLRDCEQRVLRWANVDLEHAVISVAENWDKDEKKARDGTKTDTSTRQVPIPATLLPLLRAMYKEAGGSGLVCRDIFGQPSMARALRTHLRNAGVDRPALLKRTAVSLWVTWHDLRATCGTWLAVEGRPATEIRDLLGHEKTDQTDGYMRNATVVRSGRFGQVFGPLPASLLGSSGNAPNSPGAISGGEDRGNHETFCGADGNRTAQGEFQETQAERGLDLQPLGIPRRSVFRPVPCDSSHSRASLQGHGHLTATSPPLGP